MQSTHLKINMLYNLRFINIKKYICKERKYTKKEIYIIYIIIFYR